MHKFDVRYSFDNYYEYYKFALIKQRILRDLILSTLNPRKITFKTISYDIVPNIFSFIK